MAARTAGVRPGEIEIRIEDRGPGLPAAERDRIFEPFTRVPGSDGDGFGLGLAIAKRAIEAHGGQIEARDREGGGLSMRIELPFANAGEPAGAAPARRRPGN